MSKSRERNPDQLQLRVFAKVDGGLRGTEVSRQTNDPTVKRESGDPRTASMEDRAIYAAIVERYFSSDR